MKGELLRGESVSDGCPLPGGGSRVRLVAIPSGLLVVALVIMPLVGHGCHSDDADHEPGFIPPPRPPRVEFPGSDARPTPHRR